jgi:predicted RNase H-like HicB family nuclease
MSELVDNEPVHDGRWWVLVEETAGTYQARRLLPIRAAEDREDALRLAEEVARTYEPTHPAFPRRRSLFRTPTDGWVVEVEGATASFHFTVIAAKWIESLPA